MENDQERKHSKQMRTDWDRRIATDYRFWMSDGVASDQVMWETGERDLSFLLGDSAATDLSSWRVLDLGSGVGRLMLPASKRFAHVLGLDVSDVATEKAKAFLSETRNTEVRLIDGLVLQGVDDAALDAVYSFAVLGHMPAFVFASYLREIHRVLKVGGKSFLQIYLGREQETVLDDTLAVRSYEEELFREAVESAGFRIASLEELVMPFDARDLEKGIFPYVLRVEKTQRQALSVEGILSALLREQEKPADEEWPGSRLEYQMSVTRVHQLIEEGKLQEAKEMLEFAVSRYDDAEEEAHRVLEELSKD